MYKSKLLYSFVAALLSFPIGIANGWERDTHVYMAQRASDYLANRASGIFFRAYKDDFFEGVEEADSDGRNMLHHITFDADGNIIHDTAAVYVREVGNEAIGLIQQDRRSGEVAEQDKKKFAEDCGIIVHVISDMHAFHVISGESQADHARYERDVDAEITVTSDGNFQSKIFSIGFDGTLREGIDPYAGVIEVAEDSFFGDGSVLPAEKIDKYIESIRDNDQGVGEWKKEVRRSTKATMRKAANVASEVLEQLHKKAFEDPLPEEIQLLESENSLIKADNK